MHTLPGVYVAASFFFLILSFVMYQGFAAVRDSRGKCVAAKNGFFLFSSLDFFCPPFLSRGRVFADERRAAWSKRGREGGGSESSPISDFQSLAHVILFYIVFPV